MADDQNANSRQKRAGIGKPKGRYCVYLETGMEHLKVPRQTLSSQRRRTRHLQGGVHADNHDQLDNQDAVMQDNEFDEPQDNRNVEELGVDNILIEPMAQHSLHHLVDLFEQENPLNLRTLEEPGPVMANEEEDAAVPCVGVCVCGHCDLLTEETVNEVPDVHVVNEGKAYKVRYNFNEPIDPCVNTTKFEALLLVLHMALRHGMTGPLIEDQLKFVNALFGKTVIPVSLYIFKKLFTPTSLLQFHFYCSNCNFYLGEKDSFGESFVNCEACGTLCNVHDLQEGSCFITLRVKDQLEELINRPDIKLVSRYDRANSKLIDMIDGSAYRNLCKTGEILSDPNSLTITFNTDGAQVFNTGKGSLWPIQFIVNEVDPTQRFRAENVGLLGLWFGKGSPEPSMFMTPFIIEMQELAAGGITKRLQDGSAVQCPVFAITCCLDNIAQAKFGKRKQFNGRFGCGYCFHPNTPITDPSSSKIIRKYTAVEYPYRTHLESVSDMYTADLLNKEGLLKRSNVGKDNETWDDVRGMKGITPFIELPGFDAVFSFAIDYMHNMMNVMDKLYELLFSPKSKEKDYYIKSAQQREVNKRILSISPPQGMFRGTPRSLDDFCDWKAVDCRSFILDLMLPCLDGLLPPRYFDNLRDLVCGYQILLQESISHDELSQADRHLRKFVERFNVLYGDAHMTYNIHLCSHLAHMVSIFGPLWCYSAFPFESGNGHLVKLVKGTRGVVTQIAQKYATVQAIPKYVQEFRVSQRVMDECKKICSYSRLKNGTEFNDGTGLSSEIVCKSSNAEKDAMRVAEMPVSDIIKYFNRVVRADCVYYSAAYKRPSRFNDTCASLVTGGYVIIQKLSEMRPGELWAFVNPLRLSENEQQYLAPHIKTCASRMYAPLCLIPFSEVAEKCCLVTINERNFVCVLPNRYERN